MVLRCSIDHFTVTLAAAVTVSLLFWFVLITMIVDC